jgi:group I intron endonuclease
MFIYKFTHIESGRSYIGQTIQDPNNRRLEHISHARYSPKSHHFHNALRKYGIENFTFDVIASASSMAELNALEIEYVKKYDSINNGFNIRDAGGNKRHNPESIKRMSESQKEAHARRRRLGTDTFTRKDGGLMNGKTHREDSKTKMSISHMGKVMSDETKKKISDSKKGGIPWNKGIKGTTWSDSRRAAQNKKIMKD